MAKLNEKIGRVSAASVEKGTGKNWDQWLKVLKQAGAGTWTHQEIVAFLKKKHKLSPWWQQGVTLGFEIATGRRVEGQSLKGDYSVAVTRNLQVSAKAAWKFLGSAKGLALWIAPMSEFKLRKGDAFEVDGGIYGEVRSVKAPARARLTWQETEWPKPSVLQLGIVARGKTKCTVYITHGGIKTVALREQLRTRWKQSLDRVKESFSSPP